MAGHILNLHCLFLTFTVLAAECLSGEDTGDQRFLGLMLIVPDDDVEGDDGFHWSTTRSLVWDLTVAIHTLSGCTCATWSLEDFALLPLYP